MYCVKIIDASVSEVARRCSNLQSLTLTNYEQHIIQKRSATIIHYRQLWWKSYPYMLSAESSEEENCYWWWIVYCLLSTVYCLLYASYNLWQSTVHKTTTKITKQITQIHVCIFFMSADKYNSTLRYTHTFFNFKQYISINIRFLFHLFVLSYVALKR